jgi:hypothetical protein
MRRRLAVIAALAAVLLSALAAVPAAIAQEETGHPLIGAWIFIATADPDAEPDLITFGADGNVLIGFLGGLAVGTWSPSGASRGDLTAVWPHSEEPGYLGIGIARGSLEVSADGETVTGAFTNEYPTGSGATTGQLGRSR